MIDRQNRLYCDKCGCYLGEIPVMLHDEYGRPTHRLAFCGHCGAEVDGELTVRTAKSSEIDAWFEKCWQIYPRHTNKVAARKAFEHKIPRIYDDAHKKAVRIYRTIEKQVTLWDERDVEEQFIPYMSSWLNANFETVRKTKQRSKK